MFNGELTLKTVAPEFTERVWRDGGHVLGDTMPHAECTPDQLKYRLTHGDLTLLVAVDAAGAVRGYAAVEAHRLPNLRVLHIEAVHAPGCPKLVIAQLENYARSLGCTALRAACAPAAARLFQRDLGFTESYIINHKEI